MTRSSVFLVVVAVVLAFVYAVYFTNWFQRPAIGISPRPRLDRVSRIAREDDGRISPMVFKLDKPYALTSIKVYIESELATNKYAPALWHLTSEKGIKPTDVVVYGARIKGMKSQIPKARPLALTTNVSYVVMLEAGRLKGQTNFHARLPLVD